MSSRSLPPLLDYVRSHQLIRALRVDSLSEGAGESEDARRRRRVAPVRQLLSFADDDDDDDDRQSSGDGGAVNARGGGGPPAERVPAVAREYARPAAAAQPTSDGSLDEQGDGDDLSKAWLLSFIIAADETASVDLMATVRVKALEGMRRVAQS